jgi:hypothetical protein
MESKRIESLEIDLRVLQLKVGALECLLIDKPELKAAYEALLREASERLVTELQGQGFKCQ